MKRTRGRRRAALLGARKRDAFSVEDAWERCLYRSEPAAHTPGGHRIYQSHRDTPGAARQGLVRLVHAACACHSCRNHSSNRPQLAAPVTSKSAAVMLPEPHPLPAGTEGREACIAMLQANRAQNVFMLVVPVIAGVDSFSPGEDPVVAAIAFARYADGQRHVVVLLPGALPCWADHSCAAQCSRPACAEWCARACW